MSKVLRAPAARTIGRAVAATKAAHRSGAPSAVRADERVIAAYLGTYRERAGKENVAC